MEPTKHSTSEPSRNENTMSPEEIAADIVVSDPDMLSDALYHTEQLNRHEYGEETPEPDDEV